jgi:hypothetical protein
MLAMSLSKKSFEQEVDKFRLYTLHSSFARILDKSEWLCQQLRSKMLSSLPNCLVKAATGFDITLDPQECFHTYVVTDLYLLPSAWVAWLLQTHLLGRRLPKRAASHDGYTKAQGKKRKGATGAPQGSFKRTHPAKEPLSALTPAEETSCCLTTAAVKNVHTT